MFLHIGKEKILKEETILGIFDVSSIKESKEYQELIKKLEEKKAIFHVEEKEEKSFILVQDGEIQGFFSSISSVSLAKRGMEK